MDKENLTEENKQKSDNENISVNDGAKDENVSITTQRKNKNLLKISISCIALLILIAGSIIGYTQYKSYKKDIEAANKVTDLIHAIGKVSLNDECATRIWNASQAYNALTDKQKTRVSIYSTLEAANNKYYVLKYKDNLVSTANNLSKGEFICEYMNSQIEDAWHNAVYRNYDRYNQGNYDINHTISAFFSDSDNANNINGLKYTLKPEIDNLMKELINPPNEYKDEYEALLDVYGVFTQSFELTTNPSGSYKTYTAKIDELKSDFASRYGVLKALIPEIANSPSGMMSEINEGLAKIK